MRNSTAPVYCLGANYKTTPLSLLEKLSVDEDSYAGFIGGLLDRLRGCSRDGEIAIVGTCNRLEIYWTVGPIADIYHGMAHSEGSHAPAVPEQGAAGCQLRQFRGVLSEKTGISEADLSSHLMFLSGNEAIEHLFRVAAGLESLVLGEHQILGQVDEGLSGALHSGAAGPALSAMFTAALRSGRRARKETEIGRNPRDVSTVAIQLAEKIVGELSDRRVLVAGTGEMGRLTVKALHHRGVKAIDIVNRGIEGARDLADQWGHAAHPMSEMTSLLERADIVIASTASRTPILSPAQVRSAMEKRQKRSLILIDLAVPRDIAPAVADIPGVHLFDLDSLKELAEAGERERRKAIPAVERIIAEELIALRSELGTHAVRPVLSALWTRAEEVRAQVVQHARASLHGLDDEQWREIDRMTHVLTNKLLHAPSTHLRSETLNGHAVEYAAVVAELFGLRDGNGEPEQETKP